MNHSGEKSSKLIKGRNPLGELVGN